MSAPVPPPSVPVEPRTPLPEGGGTDEGAARAAERADLARVIQAALDEWQRDDDSVEWQHDVVADRVLAAGYRRVAEDPDWSCDRCGSAQWVGWRAGPAHEGFQRFAQCVPCGRVQDLPAALRGGEQR